MLILTRRIGEGLVIGKDPEIRVNVLGIARGQVRLGIDAPKEVTVNRDEVHERIQQEQYQDNERY